MLPPGVRKMHRVTRAAAREPCRPYGARHLGSLQSVPGSSEPGGLPDNRWGDTVFSGSAEPEEAGGNTTETTLTP